MLRKLSFTLSLTALTVLSVNAFVSTKASVSKENVQRRNRVVNMKLSSSTGLDILEGVDALPVDRQEDLKISSIATMEIKRRLLDLLPRMVGTAEEFRDVETYVNTLEKRHTPVQTLDFLNLAMSGEWQLLFSTNLSGGPKSNFRLRELFQRVEPNLLEGTVENKATWDLADGGDSFDATGTFTVKCSYKIKQGSRMVLNMEDHTIELGKGSAVPKDLEGLVGLLHRAMPKELFDPTGHAMDTTYLDGELRIVRMTGLRFEGVRGIFIRRGSMEINPVKAL